MNAHTPMPITKALILSAGKGSRLLPLTEHRPKCLLEISGRTLLDRQLDALEQIGIEEIVVVSGFGDDQVDRTIAARPRRRATIRTLYNPFYHVADNLGSVWMARHEFDRDLLLLNGDTLVSPPLLERVLREATAEISLAIDRKADYDADDMKVCESGGRLTRIGKTLSPEGVTAESIGLLAFRGAGRRAFIDTVERLIRTPDGTTSWYLRAIDGLADRWPIATISVEGFEWVEVDYPEDYAAAVALTARWDEIDPSRARISVFDLDRTLTRRPTYSLFLLRAAAQHSPLRLLFAPVILVAMILHKAGLLPRKRLKELMHGLLLGRRIGADRLARLTSGFVDRLQADGLYPAGLAQLSKDRDQGRLLVLATAAPDYYAGAIATRLGFDAAISTRCCRDGDEQLARIDGPNCYGHDKLCALQAWLDERGLKRQDVHMRFYSDDRADLPLFEWVDEPIVVNAPASFAAFARARGWTLADWRSVNGFKASRFPLPAPRRAHGQAVGGTQRQRDDRQRGIRPARGREERAAGNV